MPLLVAADMLLLVAAGNLSCRRSRVASVDGGVDTAPAAFEKDTGEDADVVADGRRRLVDVADGRRRRRSARSCIISFASTEGASENVYAHFVLRQNMKTL